MSSRIGIISMYAYRCCEMLCMYVLTRYYNNGRLESLGGVGGRYGNNFLASDDRLKNNLF
jgi:hypothetical protein